jgi:hypothetical protein
MVANENMEIKFSNIQSEFGAAKSTKLSDYYKGGEQISASHPSVNIPERGKISFSNFSQTNRSELTFNSKDELIWKWGVGVWDYDIYSFGHKSNCSWVNINDIKPDFFLKKCGFVPKQILICATGKEVTFKVKTELNQQNSIELVNFNKNEGPGVTTFLNSNNTISLKLNSQGDLWIFSRLNYPTASSSPVGGSIKLISAC